MLDKTFRIVPIDDKNIELQEYTSFKNKDEEIQWSWSCKGYYHSTTSAIKAYCNLRTMRCKNTDELISTMEDIHDKIDKFFGITPDDKTCTCKGDCKKG